MPRPWGHRHWSSLTRSSVSIRAERRATGAAGAVVVVCGEQLDGELRAVLVATMNEGQERDGRDTAGTPEVVIVEELCAHPERVSLFWGRSRPTSLVALGCTHAGASDAVHEAVRCGLDTAHGAAMSLAPALTQDTPDARHRLLAATCHAGSRRARLLIDRPPAARLP